MPNKFFRRSAAAQYIREEWGVPCAPRTLAKLATIGGGPEMQKLGRIPLYTPQSLDEWVQSRLSRPVHSTSEYEAEKSERQTRGAVLSSCIFPIEGS
jgi:hypothetical protein